MSATIGFARMAALTHEMEDVFELLRQREGGLERGAVTVLLRCLGLLAADRGLAQELARTAESLEALVGRFTLA